MEARNLSSSTHKYALVVDNAQSTGIVANIASVSSMTLGCKVDNIVSYDVYDKQGEKHLGMTQLPIPVFGASQEKVKEIRKLFNSLKTEELILADSSTTAQQSKTCDEYRREMCSANEVDLHYAGTETCVEKKIINKVTGCLNLIR